MKLLCTLGLGFALAIAPGAVAQAQSPSANTDVYHVHFTKALPGEAIALGEFLKKPDPQSPMPEHFIVLRHQQGDDWDYVVIEHVGAKATIDPAGTPPNAGRDLRAWHADTFVSGPSWPEFTRAMGIGQGSTAGAVYSVAVWRAAAGHREQLEQALRAPTSPSQKPGNNVVLAHLEGGPWTFLSLDKYNSWEDFGRDQAATATGAGWATIRQHSTYHHDTVADRIAPK
ncbi:MAG: hypothetical protein JJE40_04750 [Vicinamibacteria bacterium]|nr:hypothetical protein [Vicinamibacteria bacterium]